LLVAGLWSIILRAVYNTFVFNVLQCKMSNTNFFFFVFITLRHSLPWAGRFLFFIFSHGFTPVPMGLHPGLYSVGLSALFGDDPPSQFLSMARQDGSTRRWTMDKSGYMLSLLWSCNLWTIKNNSWKSVL